MCIFSGHFVYRCSARMLEQKIVESLEDLCFESDVLDNLVLLKPGGLF